MYRPRLTPSLLYPGKSLVPESNQQTPPHPHPAPAFNTKPRQPTNKPTNQQINIQKQAHIYLFIFIPIPFGRRWGGLALTGQLIPTISSTITSDTQQNRTWQDMKNPQEHNKPT